MKKSEKGRRGFLKKTGVVALTSAVAPGLLARTQTSDDPSSKINTCDPTTLDYYGQGPFYTSGAPQMTDNQMADPDEPGARLIISGIVKTLDCTSVIPNTEIDVWHADDSGQYDNQGFNLRGKTYTNDQGFYIYETILPGKYLNGNSYRPKHIHLKITPPNYPSLITQLYFEGDTDISGDAAASIDAGTYDATDRIIPISLNNDDKYEGTFDIILVGDGMTVGTEPLHVSKGILYNAYPNPFMETLTIEYGIFESSDVSIDVYNLQGSLVAKLEQQQMTTNKYQSIWNPGTDIPSGVYFIALKINDLQVHYKKVVKR